MVYYIRHFLTLLQYSVNKPLFSIRHFWTRDLGHGLLELPRGLRLHLDGLRQGLLRPRRGEQQRHGLSRFAVPRLYRSVTRSESAKLHKRIRKCMRVVKLYVTIADRTKLQLKNPAPGEYPLMLLAGLVRRHHHHLSAERFGVLFLHVLPPAPPVFLMSRSLQTPKAPATSLQDHPELLETTSGNSTPGAACAAKPADPW